MQKILERSRPPVSVVDFPPERIEAFLREELARHGVIEAYLFGSLVSGGVHPWSDIDLVIVIDTEKPFVERPRAFAGLAALGVPVDLLVYTPAEFARLRQDESPFWKSFNRHHRRLL
jgi:uncharacterized protein